MSDTIAAEELGPALLRVDPDLFHRLRVRARGLSARFYGCPVYLVGSAVTRDDPRDIDIVVVLPVDLFVAAYGDPGDDITHFLRAWGEPKPGRIWQRWARECAKQGASMTREFHRSVDFKVLHDRDVRTISDAPRVTLCHVDGGVW